METGYQEGMITLLSPQEVEKRIKKHVEEANSLLHELAMRIVVLGGQTISPRVLVVTICGKLQIVAMNAATSSWQQSHYGKTLHLFVPSFLRCLVETDEEAEILIAFWKEHHAAVAV